MLLYGVISLVLVRQMAGELGRLYSQWRSILLKCWAHCEAVIDFAEDEADVGEEQVCTCAIYCYKIDRPVLNVALFCFGVRKGGRD